MKNHMEWNKTIICPKMWKNTKNKKRLKVLEDWKSFEMHCYDSFIFYLFLFFGGYVSFSDRRMSDSWNLIYVFLAM